MKFNKEIFREEFKKNIKKEKKRYNKKFCIILFSILFVYTIIGDYFRDSVTYNAISFLFLFAFLSFWNYKYPIE